MSQYSTDTSVSSSGQAPDAVSLRAYEIWEREGRPEGCDLQHWLQAEQELSSGNSNQEKTPVPSHSRNTGTDTKPLQGTRAAQANSRGAKRNSGAPFVTEKNGASGSDNVNPAGGSGAGKRKPPSASVL